MLRLSRPPYPMLRSGVAVLALLTLTACDDIDLRGDLTGGFDTSDAARIVTQPRPGADDRGVISYPGYQVAVARRGDRVEDVAARVGLSGAELARFNGIPDGAMLRDGEIIALPRRVAEPSAETGAPAERIDVQTLAGSAIDRAEQQSAASAPATAEVPVRHKVERGETAFSISRLYGVPLGALAEWNSLPTNYALREGQFLLIPTTAEIASRPAAEPAAPGAGSRAPVPPSAALPLPPSSAPATSPPPSPRLDRFASQTTAAEMVTPVQGSILRDFQAGRSEGIDYSAAAGTPVRAAAAGTVAAVTRDTDGVPILVLRHSDGLLTVYAGLDNLQVGKDDPVTRGQKIAEVRAGTPPFLHFEVRRGLQAIDPTPFLTP